MKMSIKSIIKCIPTNSSGNNKKSITHYHTYNHTHLNIK